MSKEDIINYVMTTPSNPNRAVLTGMLDSIAESGGSTVEVSKIKIGTVTVTMASDSYHAITGGNFADGKTLSQLVGDKPIIGFETKDLVAGLPMGVMLFANSVNPIVDYETAKDATAFSVGLWKTGLGAPISGASVDIYAICI